MALIKSALELAMERTKDLKVDEAALESTRIKAEGKRAASKYIEDPASSDLETIIAQCDPKNRDALRKGALEVLAANLQMPIRDTSFDIYERLASGYAILAGSSGLHQVKQSQATVKQLFGQVTGLLKKYLEDMANVEQMIRKQWAPRLREKERQMAARMGQDVRLDPMNDPEFAAFYKQNVDAVRQHYQDALDQAKAELARLCGFETEAE
jgi:hypothetical protein